MFGSGHWLYLVIFLVIALIIFGPNRLPELGSGLGRAIREFRKATTETGDEIRGAVNGAHGTQPPVQQQYVPPQQQYVPPQQYAQPQQQPAQETPPPNLAGNMTPPVGPAPIPSGPGEPQR